MNKIKEIICSVFNLVTEEQHHELNEKRTAEYNELLTLYTTLVKHDTKINQERDELIKKITTVQARDICRRSK
jgi:hypothetical protein